MAPTPVSELLSHLKRCDKCDYYIGAPRMCKKSSDQTHNGYWFEKCLNNEEPKPKKCKHFEWLEKKRWGDEEAARRPCPGPLCRDAKNKGTLNGDCTFGVCLKCCRHIQPLLPVARACYVYSHKEGIQFPERDGEEEADVESNPATAPPKRKDAKPAKAKARAAEPKAKARAAKPKAKARATEPKAKARAADLPPLIADDDDDDDGPIPQPVKGPSRRVSYATPTGPAYQVRMSVLDAEQRLDEEHRANRARQMQAKSNIHVITLRWWRKNGEEAEIVEIEIENPSAFHPKDIPQLVKDYLCDTDRFQYYDSKKCLWYTGSNGTAPRNVTKLGEDDLCYRSDGVKWGESMPGVQNKRPAPEESHAPQTPRRPLPPFAEYLATPVSGSTRSVSPSSTTPPRSGSSNFPDDDELDYLTSSSSFPLSITPIADEPSPYDNLTPLPALFPTEPDIPPSAMASSSSQTFDLSTAPRGKSTWPWKYACDMASGFDAMRRLEDGHPGKSRKEAFELVFQHAYKNSTFQDQMRAWKAAGAKDGERAWWIRQGRSEAGEWAKFMSRWHRR